MATKERKNWLSGLRKIHFTYKEREYFSANLAMMLRSAVPIGQALDSLRNTTNNQALKKTLAQMQTDIEAGLGLADALQRSGLVSPQTLVLVRLGEKSGHLIDNLELAAQQEEKRHMFAARVRSALIYPSFVLGLTVLVGLGVAWFLLPRLAVTFSELKVALPFITKMMIGCGVFLRDYGYIAVPLGLLALVASGYVLFVAPRTRAIGMRLLFRLPGIGRLMSEVEIAQFGYLLGTLLNAGLPVTQAVRLLAGASTAPHYKRFYTYLADSIGDGYSFKDSLHHYTGSLQLIPPAIQQMMIAGESSGSLPEVLATIGRTYEQKSDITTQNLQSILEPILLVIVWIGVMLVAVAVIVPIYSLVGGLRQ
ncbi:MAG TPA: type II secretion system F family protein [Candidatus Saccharimonadales bacterium]|nr:type II secretion system F family protein [Candidatus Saccharimonadales bacterium]